MKVIFRECPDDSGFGFIEDESGKTLAHTGTNDFTADERREHGLRLVATWNAFIDAETSDIEQVGDELAALLLGSTEAPLPESQWMQIAALLMHRFALQGETVRITPEEMQQLDARYPDGADLRAEDGEGGTVEVTLLPTGEHPTGIIVIEGGKPGQIVT